LEKAHDLTAYKLSDTDAKLKCSQEL